MNCKQFDECGRDAYSKGLCLMHYKRVWRKTTSGKASTKKDYDKQVNDPDRLAAKRKAVNAWIKSHRQEVNSNGQKRRMALRGGYNSPTVCIDRLLSLVFMDKCCKCDSTTDLEVDHIVPVSKGGPNTYENYQTLCKPCNSGKKDRYHDYRPLTLRNTSWMQYMTGGVEG